MGPLLSTDALMRDIRRTLAAEMTRDLPGAERQLLIEEVYARAHEARALGLLYFPHLMKGEERDWRIDEPLKVTSHRPVVGPLLVAFKRYILIPLGKWIGIDARERFARQQQLNETLIACVETLTLQNAELAAEIHRLRAGLEDGAGG